jgi:hypothetical protein
MPGGKMGRDRARAWFGRRRRGGTTKPRQVNRPRQGDFFARFNRRD